MNNSLYKVIDYKYLYNKYKIKYLKLKENMNGGKLDCEYPIDNIIEKCSNDNSTNNDLLDPITYKLLENNILKLNRTCYEYDSINQWINQRKIGEKSIDIFNNEVIVNDFKKCINPTGFENSNNLIIREGVTEINYREYFDKKIETVKLPNSLRVIGDSAFNSNLIRRLEIPEGVRVIKFAAFGNNELLESVSLPESLRELGKLVFHNTSLKEVRLPSKIDTISEELFRDSKLEYIDIPVGVRRIKNFAFLNNKLKSLNIPNTVKVIDMGAFSGNVELKNIVIPDSVKFIGEGAFDEIVFDTVILPKSLKKFEKEFVSNSPINFV